MATAIVQKKMCSIDGCERPVKSRGYCANHYARWRYYGDATKGRDSTKLGEPLRWIQQHASYQDDDCIVWPFQRTRYGYGTVRHNGKHRVASRVMCEIAHGLAPSPNMDAAHTCGHGAQGCMNPRHLQWETRRQNSADKIRHGTQPRGSRVPSAKITEAQARKVLELYGKRRQADIAEAVDVPVSVVRKIHAGVSWRWLADKMNVDVSTSMRRRGSESGNAKLTEDDVREIRQLRGKMQNKEIARMFDIDQSYVSKIQLRKWWGWLDA